jgi:hypothetical protein
MAGGGTPHVCMYYSADKPGQQEYTEEQDHAR